MWRLTCQHASTNVQQHLRKWCWDSIRWRCESPRVSCSTVTSHTHEADRGGQKYLQTEGLKKQCQLTDWKWSWVMTKEARPGSHDPSYKATRQGQLGELWSDSFKRAKTSLQMKRLSLINLCRAHLRTTNCRSYIEAEHFRATVWHGKKHRRRLCSMN